MSGENKTNGNLYQFGNVTIDCENFRVLKAGEHVALTPRAFDVLVFLLKNNNRVVEKQELFEKIWKETFVSDNALTKVIKEIRQGIDDDAAAPRYIETVPRRGYRFIASCKNDEEVRKASQVLENKNNRKTVLPKGRRFLLAAGIILGLVVSALGFVVLSEMRSEYIAANTPIDSIAVIPFEIDSTDSETEIVSDQLTENLINSLSENPNVRVLPRNTVFIYKNKREDPHVLGRSLRVRAVLSGRIIRQDDILKVQVELIDVERKAQLWGHQYNHSIAGVGSLQKEITQAVNDYLSQSAPINNLR